MKYSFVYVYSWQEKATVCSLTYAKGTNNRKMPYDTVMVADFADLECEASAKSVTGTRYE